MWVFDVETLRFLEVNEAAVARYGYSRDAFLQMTILDIRPPEDAERVRSSVQGSRGRQDVDGDGGPWRHLTRDGRLRFMDIRSHDLIFNGRSARLIAARDVTELVQVRRHRDELDQRLADTLESIGEAFFTLDRDWRFTFINREAERLLQRDRNELLGRNVWDLFPDAVGGEFHQAYLRAIESGETARFTAHYARLGIWLHVTAHPTSEGLAVNFRDVTQERADQQQLKLLEAAVSRINDMLLITEAGETETGAGHRIVYVNDAFVRLTGFGREEVIGATPRILHGPGTDPDEVDRIRRCLDSGQPVRAELKNYTKAGKEIWLEHDIVPLTDGSELTHFVGVQRDVTARKRDEAVLRESEERFQMIARATHDAIWEWDLVTGAVWWNENFEISYGHARSPEQTTYEFWESLVHPEDRARVLSGIEEVLAGADSTWSAEYRLRRADGAYAQVIDRGFVLRDAEDRPSRMVGSLMDVTAQRELEAKTRQAQKLEAIGQLTGGLAHDFNNLLTIMLGSAEVLSEALFDAPDLKELADMTLSAADRGAELTNHLLAFARRQALKPQSLDPAKLTSGVEKLLRRTLSEDIRLVLELQPDVRTIEVDPGQLEVALVNLVINARDAMPRGGTISIDVRDVQRDEGGVTGDWVAITVADTGIGMSEETLARAFEPFYTTKPVGSGSGLGLSMVYGFVNQSGGEVQIASRPGEGCAITLLFPGSTAAPAVRPSAHGGAEVRGSGERILVAEDDPMVRSHLVSNLQALGYAVVAVADGDEALEQLARTGADLLLTDVVMPGAMDGGQLADEARRRWPGLKVLFTSGYSRSALMEGGRLRPDVQLLAKPYRRRELAAKVREVLES